MYGLRMWLRGSHPVHGLPFHRDVLSELSDEFRALPAQKRLRQRLKVVQRDLYLLFAGEAFACRERAPAGVRRVLWIYQWTTIGDAIMDLAARHSVPAEIELDLCIVPPLAPLFRGDGRFRAVYTNIVDCPPDGYDFIVLHELTSTSVREKRSRFPGVPFAPMIGYLFGERFARVPFADARLRHVFGLPHGPVPRPTIALGAVARPRAGPLQVAVALGARDPRRGYPHWAGALRAIVSAWPVSIALPHFHFFGAAGAAADLAGLGADFVTTRGSDHIGRLELLQTAHAIRDCHAFLGADGGLMHIAEAAGLGGLALFTVISPSMRLGPQSALRTLEVSGALSDLAPQAVAAAFVAAIEGDAHRLTVGATPN